MPMHRRCANMSKHLALLGVFAAISLAAPSAMADARDGLKFWWKAEKKTAVGAALEARELTERVTYSAGESPVCPSSLNHRTTSYTYTDGSVFEPTPMCITNMAVFCPTSKRTVYEDCLYLPQPTDKNASGTLMQDFQRVILPGASSVIDKEGTLFVRFKWLGRTDATAQVNFIGVGAAWSTCGWVLSLKGYGTQKNSYLTFRNFKSNSDQMFNSGVGECPADTWIEVAVTVKPVSVEGVEKTELKFYKRRENALHNTDGTPKLDKGSATVPAITASTGANRICRISNTDGTGWKTAAGTSSFRGFIHEIKMYDRVLDEDEVVQMMAGDDLEWSIGTKNGSANEFSDSEAVAVFEPATMPWHRFRRKLTAENPSVSIRTELDADGYNLARLLQIRIAGSAPNYSRLVVSMNGNSVANKDLHLATERNDGNVFVFLSDNVMRKLTQDSKTGKYPMTLTLTRTGEMSGDIEMDWLYLGGAFQLGKLDGKKSEFSDSNDTIYYHYLTPMRNIKRLSPSFGYTAGSSYINLDVSFFMPEGATNYPHRLCMTGVNHAGYSLYLNEKTESKLLKTVTDCAVPYEVELPAGSLNTGLNKLYFVGSGDGKWSDFECIRLMIENNGGKNRDPGIGTILFVE